MGDTARETISCQYCETDIQVSAERSRYEASVAHFETEHVQRSDAPQEASGQTSVAARTASPSETEEQGISD